MTPYPGTNLALTQRPMRKLAYQSRCALVAGITLAATGSHADNLLEELVVTSSRVPMALREVGTSVSVLTEAEIQQRGFLSLPEILRTQPAVAVSNSGGVGKTTTVRIRGEEGFRTMVLLDGIDMSDPSGVQVSPRLDQLLTAGVERVEILRGPQGLSYGADAGGIINMRTETPDEGFGGRLSAETGRFGTTQLSGSVGADIDDVDFVVSATQFETDGFNARETGAAEPDDDGYENTTLHARGGWDVNENLRLEAVARSIDGETEFDACFGASGSTDNCLSDFQQDSWLLRAEFGTGALQHQLSYAETDTERESFSDNASSFSTEGKLERLSYVGQWRSSDALSLVYGFDHETESVDDGSLDRERDQTGLYGEYQGRFDQLTITAGMRYDDNDDFGEFTSYRLAAAYVVPFAGGDLKFKGTYGTGFRAPSLFEISYNNGPFALPPASETVLVEETSEGYDLGVVWAKDTGTYLEITWFDQTIDDLITFDVVGFSGYLQDAGESNSQGIELAGRVALPAGFDLSGNYTWNDTETPSGEQRVRRPEQLLNLSLNYQGLDGKLRLGVNLRSASDAIDIRDAVLEDYTVVDANASYRITPSLLAHLRIENALNEDYQEVTTFNTAGAATYAGIRYEF
ncbi:MAG: TonB-dependent receptor [Pseudomonadota bacterium]